jgi:hypothetical protein
MIRNFINPSLVIIIFIMRTLRFSGGEAVRSDRWFAFDFILF